MFKFNGALLFVESDGGFDLPGSEFSGVWNFTGIVFFEPGMEVFRAPNVKMFRLRPGFTVKNINVEE